MAFSLPFNLGSINFGSLFGNLGSILNPGSLIPDLQKQNFKSLIGTIKDSVDVVPSFNSLTELRSSVKDAWSDRSITVNELTGIVTDVMEVVDSTGITPDEARNIFYDLQEIVDASRLPKSHDELTGTVGNNTLWGGRGNDRLTGVAADSTGVGEIDRLAGGSGKDQFVLGNSTSVFYDDGLTATPGLNDYAVLLDFNLQRDKIQLHGQATDYGLGALPEELTVSGTGIYYKNSTGTGTPELIGVVTGVTLTDFNTGFTFV